LDPKIADTEAYLFELMDFNEEGEELEAFAARMHEEFLAQAETKECNGWPYATGSQGPVQINEIAEGKCHEAFYTAQDAASQMICAINEKQTYIDYLTQKIGEAFGADFAMVKDKCDMVEAKIENLKDEFEYRTGEADDHAECDGSVPIDFSPFELPPEVPEMSMVMLPNVADGMALYD